MNIFEPIISNGTILSFDRSSYDGSREGRLMPDRMIRIDRHPVRRLHSEQPWDYHLLDHVPDRMPVGASATAESGTKVIDRPGDVMRDIENLDLQEGNRSNEQN